MRDSTIAGMPSTKVVAMEQIRLVGLAVRLEVALCCAALLLLVVILPFVELSPDDAPFDLDPADLGYIAILAGLVAPLGIWKGERLFGESELWTVPVDHARHARLKIAAGWMWLMALVALGVLAFSAAAALTGGSVGVDEMRLFVVNPDQAQGGPAGPLAEVRWSSQPWQWVLPFTAATAVYLAASAFLAGIRRPIVWGVGCWLAGAVLAEVSGIDSLSWFGVAIDMVLQLFYFMVDGGESVSVLLDSGERVRAWTRFPTVGSWASATLMWLVLAGTAAWAATSRHRER